MDMDIIMSLTQLIYSCWIVSNPVKSGVDTFPHADIFVYVLKEVLQRDIFPEWARCRFHFASGDTGLVCLELADIEELAANLKITGYYDFSYNRTIIQAPEQFAFHCLSGLEIPVEQAKKWGLLLREFASKLQAEMDSVPA